jgi:hypothetical protein
MSFKHGKRSAMTRQERALARIYDKLRKRAQRNMSDTSASIYLDGVRDALDQISRNEGILILTRIGT